MSRMRTQALPKYCAMKGSTTSPMPSRMKFRRCRRRRASSSAAVGGAAVAVVMAMAVSGAVRDALAEQALRPQREHEDEHDEREDVLVVAAEDAARERTDVAGSERLD